MLGIIILVVVMVIAGAGTYLALPSASSSSPTTTTHSPTPVQKSVCTVQGAPVCGTCPTGTTGTPPNCVSSKPATHDATVTSPFGTAQSGAAVAFTATIASGTAKSYSFNFGDGSQPVTSPAGTVDHTYSSPGIYYVYVQITDTTGALHDNLADMYPFTVSNSFSGDTLGNYVQTAGQITGNGTGGSTGLLLPGGSVSAAAWISANVTNPTTEVAPATAPAGWSMQPAADASMFTVTWNGATGWTPGSASTAKVVVASSATKGSYSLVYSVPTILKTTGAPINAWSNYTFTIYVGGGLPHTTPIRTSPHPGVVDNYELNPGGAAGEDPSIDYETAGAEVINNVYQTLISYNGSQAGPNYGSYVPNGATCVPGSPECAALYGSDVDGSDLTNGSAFTFVINPNDMFYNPYTTGGPVTYQVHPYDVVYSITRTCLFSGTYSEFDGAPGYQSDPGWIVCQSLLPDAFLSAWQDTASPLAPNPTWDGGLHFPLNNTPQNIMQSMTINGTDCPKVGGNFVGNGCVTFNPTFATGVPWPEFLEFLADGLGSSIQSCAWGVGMGGVSLTGWLVGGDPASCRNVPGNASASGGTSGPFPSPTAWDSYEPFGTNGNYNTYLRYHMVGSGAYYLQSYVIGQSYGLAVNPGWTTTQWVNGIGGCQGDWENGCYPTASEITVKSVSTVWETTQGPGEAAYQAGTADFAAIPTTDTSLLLQLEAEGLVGAITAPTLSIFFTNYNFAYAQGIAQTYTSTNLTAPSWIMQDLNLRHFLSAAYPYGEVQQTINTVDGIEYAVNYGGAIPQHMGSFYPTNISWPSGNPDTNPADVGGAAWWWAQTAADGDAGATCTVKNPCTIPFFSYAGDPTDDAINTLWIASIESISGHAIIPVPIDVPFITLVLSSFASPGANQMGMYVLGWAPDYPDPTDYVAPMYSPAGAYTLGTAAEPALQGGALGLSHVAWGAASNGDGYDATCAGSGDVPTVTQTCQGSAYGNMTALLNEANVCAPPTCSSAQRALLYNMAESIANNLAFMQYRFQQVGVGSYSTWINPAAFHPNPMLAGTTLFAEIQYTS